MHPIEEARKFSLAESIKSGNVFCFAISQVFAFWIDAIQINIPVAEIIKQNDVSVNYGLIERNKSERNDMFWSELTEWN